MVFQDVERFCFTFLLLYRFKILFPVDQTSLVTAIAGSLMLDVYIISLSSPYLTDNRLIQLLNSIPPHTILLMEDVDAVFKPIVKDSVKSSHNKVGEGLEERVDTETDTLNAGAFDNENISEPEVEGRCCLDYIKKGCKFFIYKV